MISYKPNLLIYDSSSECCNIKNDVVYWSGYANSKSERIFSVSQLVEENADHLKANYLKLIYEFGEIKIDGKSIISHFELRKNFSYWWMTRLAEKSNFSKSLQIDNIIKLMALENWLKQNSYKKIELVTLNNELANAISLLSKKLSINFNWQKQYESKKRSSIVTNLFNLFPNFIQQLIWLLRYLVLNWSLKGAGVKQWTDSQATTTFVSYLFNIIPEKEKKGEFGSRYWTELVNVLNEKQHATNWLHIYIKNDLLPSAKKAREVIDKFNHQENSQQCHTTLASFLTVPLIFQTLKDCYKIFKLRKKIGRYLQKQSNYLWPLFEKDYQDSIVGVTAMSNILNFNLFERAMRKLPIQKRGCYLQENQGWEFAFIFLWKSSGHNNNLVGFPHTTVRYWDLRYFFDLRHYNVTSQYNMPLPNLIGVNGEVIKQTYLDSGYSKEALMEVESLRFLYLTDFTVNTPKQGIISHKGKVVLVVLDYLLENTLRQLKLLSLAVNSLKGAFCFIIKPHPFCPVDLSDYPNLTAELSMKPIVELLRISDIVYSSAITSAAVDAYCAELPIISLLDSKKLNQSPLRGSDGVYFVSTSIELVDAINEAKVTEAQKKKAKDFFYLDTDLPRWSKWLE